MDIIYLRPLRVNTRAFYILHIIQNWEEQKYLG